MQSASHNEAAHGEITPQMQLHSAETRRTNLQNTVMQSIVIALQIVHFQPSDTCSLVRHTDLTCKWQHSFFLK